MGHQRTYSWEGTPADDPVAGKGRTEFPLRSVGIIMSRAACCMRGAQLYQERGEAAFVPNQAFHSPPEIDRPHRCAIATASRLVMALARASGLRQVNSSRLFGEDSIVAISMWSACSMSGPTKVMSTPGQPTENAFARSLL
jgi:hypothetical protein